jgi:hypothetical protein
MPPIVGVHFSPSFPAVDWIFLQTREIDFAGFFV